MDNAASRICASLAVLLTLAATVRAQEDDLAALEEIAIFEQKVMMPMRDGVRLATDIYRPKTGDPVPRFERNLNTGGKNYDEVEGVVARNVLHHSELYPSQIRLPIRRR